MTAIFSNDFTFAPVVMNWGFLENWKSTASAIQSRIGLHFGMAEC